MILSIRDLFNVFKVRVLHPVCASVLLSLHFILVMFTAFICVDLDVLAIVLSFRKLLGSGAQVSRNVSTVGLHACLDSSTTTFVSRVVVIFELVAILGSLAVINNHWAFFEAIKVYFGNLILFGAVLDSTLEWFVKAHVLRVRIGGDLDFFMINVASRLGVLGHSQIHPGAHPSAFHHDGASRTFPANGAFDLMMLCMWLFFGRGLMASADKGPLFKFLLLKGIILELKLV